MLASGFLYIKNEDLMLQSQASQSSQLTSSINAMSLGTPDNFILSNQLQCTITSCTQS